MSGECYFYCVFGAYCLYVNARCSEGDPNRLTHGPWEMLAPYWGLEARFSLTQILLFASWFPVVLLLKLSTSLFHLLTLCNLIFLWHEFYYSILKYQTHESILCCIFSNLVISSWILWSLIRCIRIYVHVFMTRGEAILLKGFMHYCLSFKIGVDFLLLQKSLVVASWPGRLGVWCNVIAGRALLVVSNGSWSGSMMQCDHRESSIGRFDRFIQESMSGESSTGRFNRFIRESMSGLVLA